MENRFASIWNHVNEGILISDKSGKIVLVNPRCAALFGYSEDEILAIGIDALIPEAARSRHKDHRERYNERPTNRSMGQNMILYGLKKDKSVFPLEISLSHYNSQGEMFVIAFIIDITERLNFQEDLQVVNKQLLTLNENLERKVKERTLVLQEAMNDLEKSQTELREGLVKEKELHEMKSRTLAVLSKITSTLFFLFFSAKSFSVAARFFEPTRSYSARRRNGKCSANWHISSFTVVLGLTVMLFISKHEIPKIV
ncbi:MAG: PAS domain S-box protein [Sediminibacterium sp.]